LRKAIALFITLGMILIITALIAKSLEISKESLEPIKTIKNINQSNALFRSVKSVLNKNLEFVEDALMLDMLFSSFPIESKNVRLLIDIEPISNKIDINYAFKDEETSLKYIEVFDFIFSKYEVLDSFFFYELIYDTLDENDISKGGFDSEIVQYDKDFENGVIYDLKHFREILKHYVKITNDFNIYNIPWSEIIYFKALPPVDPKNKNSQISMPPLYVNFLHDNLDEFFSIVIEDSDYVMSDEDMQGAIDLEIAKKYNIQYYKKGSNFLVLCKIDYIFDSIEGKLKFLYDIGSKKVIKIEEVL